MNGHLLLSIAGLTKVFGGLVAVNQISFDVHAGEVVGLLGPNGSGKTTLMNLVSGALRPTQGSVALEGRRISGLAPHRIARAGVARSFQLVRVLPSLSALENVMVGAVFGPDRLAPDAAATVARALLERVGLGGREQLHPAEMTYIDQKRIELARALAADPKVLLLDEWLAGLNPTELQTGIELIRSLQAEGRTVLMVEHVMDAIRSLCNRCVVMSAGSKLAEGTPAEVLANPDVIRAYLGDEHA
ncbi:ABC transporter ATP-binding protein [Azoarcus sp. DD4]|uniref:ABC transporter ATP-binding protein n=1 Tax=Azoarcus sp. DD4 TaxID=2027405 RepID=UPI001127E577|nr:ABC transporter ATP-binding protein [Azoarcus sp. DD4]QDF97810.1 ABC transporter ATP-binding protein [Azoarcus sp. DD4]